MSAPAALRLYTRPGDDTTATNSFVYGRHAARADEELVCSNAWLMGVYGRNEGRTIPGMDSQLLQDGLKLMLVGMGTVFVFLTLLVGATSAMSVLAQRLQPTRVTPATTSSRNSPASETEVVAAIGAALTLHRARGRDDAVQPNTSNPPSGGQHTKDSV